MHVNDVRTLYAVIVHMQHTAHTIPTNKRVLFSDVQLQSNDIVYGVMRMTKC